MYKKIRFPHGFPTERGRLADGTRRGLHAAFRAVGLQKVLLSFALPCGKEKTVAVGVRHNDVLYPYVRHAVRRFAQIPRDLVGVRVVISGRLYELAAFVPFGPVA